MAKNITISLSDAEYEALSAASARSHQTREELIAAAISDRIAASPGTPSTDSMRSDREMLLSIMRAHGHLVDARVESRQRGEGGVPPTGTTERAEFEERIGDELSDALDHSGLSVLDLVERR